MTASFAHLTDDVALLAEILFADVRS